MPRPGRPYLRARNSRIHGRGVFATRRIRKGTRIIEYTGELISHEEADRRYRGRNDPHDHTFLFSVDKYRCLDANYYGNDARFINHSCNPNCESFQKDGRIFVRAIRNIQPGVELSYDYSLTGPKPRSKTEWARYVCHCGAPNCRGTMLRSRPPRKLREWLKTQSRSPRKSRNL